MDRILRLCRSLACLPRRAGALAAFAVVPAAVRPDPPFPPGWKLAPGWNKYLTAPPGWDGHPRLLLGRVAGPVYQVPAHTATAAGLPGWQISLITAAVFVLAAALACTAYRMRATRRSMPESTAEAFANGRTHAGPAAHVSAGSAGPPAVITLARDDGGWRARLAQRMNGARGWRRRWARRRSGGLAACRPVGQR